MFRLDNVSTKRDMVMKRTYAFGVGVLGLKIDEHLLRVPMEKRGEI